MVHWGNLKKMRKTVKKLDTFVFYFSGHGIYGEKQKQSYLVTSDTVTNSVTGLWETAFPVEKLQSYIQSLNGATVLTIFDRCVAMIL